MTDPGAADKAAGSFLTFRIERQLYALPAAEVAEIIRIPAIARLPQSPPGLLGMANLRGNVLPVASLRGLLGRGAAATAAGRAIVLDGAAPIALVVDAVETLYAPDAATVETAPAALAAEPGEMLRAAFPMPAGIAKVLDIGPLLARALSRPATPAGPRQGGTRVGPRPEAPLPAEARQQARLLLTFEVAGQDYALDLDRVLAIAAAPPALATVPRADGAVLGLATCRGMLLPVLSLRALLGLGLDQAASPRAGDKVIIVQVAGSTVGLLADRARAVLRAGPATIEPAPPLLAARAGGEARLAAIHRTPDSRPIPILAPDQLFRDDVMQRLGEQKNAATAAAAADGPRTDAAFLVFRLGDEEYGLPVAAVAEVAAAPDQVTRIPRTPKFLEGVVNLRGEVLPVIDQRRRFEMPPAAAGMRRRLVVLRTAQYRAGLIVDAVREVLRMPQAVIGPGPDLAGETARLVTGVANIGDGARLVLLLDPAELLTRTERRLLDGFAAIRS